MLTYLHEAPNRYREDAYRSYCHSVDVYGSYEPASFIYMCIESFAEEAKRYGIDLRCQRKSASNKPVWFQPRSEREGLQADHSDFDGLLIRLTHREQIGLIESFLAEQKNVLLLLPNEFAALWSKADLLRPAVEDGLKRLGASHLVTSFDGKCYDRGDIWWEEVESPTGRLFISTDSHVSDGIFLDTYGYSERNMRSISRLLREFATFKRNFITITPRNVVTSWPSLEPLTWCLRSGIMVLKPIPFRWILKPVSNSILLVRRALNCHAICPWQLVPLASNWFLASPALSNPRSRSSLPTLA